jgi:hypothetical protein
MSLEISNDNLEKNIRSFNSSSAAGPFGFKPNHMLNILNSVTGAYLQILYDAIRFFINNIINDKMSTAIGPFFASAKLIPLEKRNNGIRPICVGTFWRRFTCKMVMHTYNTEIPQFFNPNQIGVKTPNGSDSVIHCFNRILSEIGNDNSYAALSVDFKNAFNRVNRQTILNETHKNFPNLYNLTKLIYQLPANLYYENNIIYNEEGAQQGCPLGSFGFSLVLQILIEKIKAKYPDIELNVWYLDDGIIIAKHETLQKIVELIKNEGPVLGLHLSLEKSCVWWPSKNETEINKYDTEL